MAAMRLRSVAKSRESAKTWGPSGAARSRKPRGPNAADTRSPRAVGNADLAAVRRELTRATAENTAVLNAVSDLTQRKRELEARLKHTQSSVFVDPAAAQRREAAEREQLVVVVNAQAAEIDTLREEIGFLSVKGTPARPEF